MKQVKNIFKIKSLVTLSVTAVFCTLALKGTVTAEQFMQVFMMIIAFYFGTQTEKENH